MEVFSMTTHERGMHVRSRVRRGLLVLVALVVLGAVIAACGGDDDGGGGATAEDIQAFQPGTNTRDDVEPGDIDVQPVEGPCKIAVLVAYNIEFFNAMAYGAQQEAERLGCETDITAAKGYGDTTNQLQQFDTALAQQPDGIVIHAADEKAIAPAVDRAWEEGIPVAYASVKGPSEKVMAVLTNDILAGRQQGEYIGNQDPNAKVIAMCGPPGIEWAKLRCQGLEQGLSETAPNAEIVAQKYHEMDRVVVANVSGSTMEGFPEADWIYNSTDLQATGVVDALRNRGEDPGKKRVTTLTIGRETQQLLEQGWIEYAVTERPVFFGELGVDLVVNAINGEFEELEESALWEPAQPAFAGKEGAQEFCPDCPNFSEGEVKLNWGPEDFQF
jgi:ABC-type sugar transport system substrate-binding protein